MSKPHSETCDGRPAVESACASDRHAVTRDLRRLEQVEGDEAFQRLYARYFRRIVGLARKKQISAGSRGAEDVAHDVLTSLWRSLSAGRDADRIGDAPPGGATRPRIQDRAHLWNLLAQMVEHRVTDVRRRRGRKKRVKPLDEAALEHPASPVDADGLQNIASPRQSQRTIAADALNDCIAVVISLKDDELRQIGLLYFSGKSQQEIAREIGRTRETVRQKLPRLFEILRTRLQIPDQ